MALSIVTRGFKIGSIAKVILRGFSSSAIEDTPKIISLAAKWSPTLTTLAAQVDTAVSLGAGSAKWSPTLTTLAAQVGE